MWWFLAGSAAYGIFKFAGNEVDKYLFPPAQQSGVSWPTVILVGGSAIGAIYALKKTGVLR